MSYPKITIVTPSFNQGQFIEETILSVLGQNYPNLEYIIIDGGSTDNTINIIKKYENRIKYWVSEKDKGQSHAINKGFKKATGEILAWLNSDDLYMPNTLYYMADCFRKQGSGIYFGNCIHFKESNGLATWGSNVILDSQNTTLEQIDFIIQPSSFWTKDVWQTNKNLDENVHFGFDWEWFLRAKRNNVLFFPLDKCLSLYRFHSLHKSSKGGEVRQNELLNIYKKYDMNYFVLYQNLMFFTQNNKKRLKYKLIKKILNIFNLRINEAELIKKLYPSLFKNYTSTEIEKVGYML